MIRDDGELTIGETARATGLTPKAIRLYERRGLIGPAKRTAAGYRLYGPDDVTALVFIGQAKAVGLRLDEIGQILDLQRCGRPRCETVLGLLDQRIADIDRTIADLHAMRRSMDAMRSRAAEPSVGPATICRLIETAD